MSMLKVVITGPESTGKSVLSEKVADYFHCPKASEYARTYIDQLDRAYHYEDLVLMAKGQGKLEQECRSRDKDLFICDTSMLTFKVWSQDKFDKCDPWIENYIEKEEVDLYLLCDLDIPWEYDPQREDPDRRTYFFNVYQRLLENMNAKYKVISGNYDERLALAISCIDEVMP